MPKAPKNPKVKFAKVKIKKRWGTETTHTFHAIKELLDQGITPTTRQVSKKRGKRIETIGEKMRKITGEKVNEKKQGRKGKKRSEGVKFNQRSFNVTSRSFAEDVLTGTSPDCVLRGQATTILNEVANHADHRELQKLAENNKKEKNEMQ